MYPSPVQRRIDRLEKYVINDELESFHIFHMYPGELAYPDGYHDARFFDLWGFNKETNEKRYLGSHDCIDIWKGDVKMIRIFADGSTLVKFYKAVEIIIGQAVTVR